MSALVRETVRLSDEIEDISERIAALASDKPVLRVVKTGTCACGSVLASYNRSGICKKCQKVRKRTGTCRQCSAAIDPNNSGLCFDCYRPSTPADVFGKGVKLNEKLAHAERLFLISRDELLGRARFQTVSRARQAVMVALFKSTTMSLSEIGRRMGRDHTTIIKGIEAAEARMARDTQYAAAIGEMLS